MAVTVSQLQSVLTQAPFLARLQYAMVSTAQAVATEATSTALHYQRKQLAVGIVNNPAVFLPNFAQLVITQLSLSTTNMVTVNAVPNADIDTTDLLLSQTCSAVFNSFFV